VEAILRKFCRELLEPEVERLRRRLLLTADLLRKTGKGGEVVEMTIAAALSMGTIPGACHCHPFLRRVALESLEMAREALAEGFDPRHQGGEGDDGEWE
jgi:hypothetical protein